MKSNSEKHSPHKGMFNSKCRKIKLPPSLSVDDIESKVLTVWASEPDALTLQDAARLTGYTHATIRNWIKIGKLKAVRLPNETITTKRWLVECVCTYAVTYSSRLSAKLKQIIAAECQSKLPEIAPPN